MQRLLVADVRGDDMWRGIRLDVLRGSAQRCREGRRQALEADCAGIGKMDQVRRYEPGRERVLVLRGLVAADLDADFVVRAHRYGAKNGLARATAAAASFEHGNE